MYRLFLSHRQVGAAVIAAIGLWALVRVMHVGSSVPIYTADDYISLGDRLVNGFQTNMVSWHLPLYGVARGLLSQRAVPEAYFNAACLMAVYGLLLSAGFLMGGTSCGLLAGLGLLGLYSRYNFNFHDIQHFYCALTLLTASLLIWRARQSSLRRTLLLALALGVSFTCRSTLVFFPPLLALFEYAIAGLRRDYWRHALILLIVPYLFLLPWLRMNWQLHREFIPFEYGQADGNIVPGALGVVGTPEGSWNALLDRPLRHRQVLGWAIKATLTHPARYLAGYGKRLALVLSWGPVLFLLALVGLWRGRSKAEVRAVGLLALYFIAVYCFMSIQPQYFKPFWLLLWLLGASGLASWIRNYWQCDERAGARFAAGAIGVSLAGAVGLAAYAMWLVGTYVKNAVPASHAALSSALGAHPRDPCLHYERGLLRLKESRPGAEEDFSRAAELNSHEARYWLALAAVQGHWSGPPPAEPHDRGDMLLLQASAELRGGRRAAARESLRAAMAAYESALYIHGVPKPGDAEILQPMHSLGDNFLHGAYQVLLTAIPIEEALALVREIEMVRPNQPSAFLEEARLAALIGDRRAARSALSRVPARMSLHAKVAALDGLGPEGQGILREMLSRGMSADGTTPCEKCRRPAAAETDGRHGPAPCCAHCVQGRPCIC